jgi:hypothetical protein
VLGDVIPETIMFGVVAKALCVANIVATRMIELNQYCRINFIFSFPFFIDFKL